MIQKFKEIHAPYKGNAKLTAAWLGITVVLVCVVYALPLLIASGIASIFKSDGVTSTMASFSMIWLLVLMFGCGIYAVKKFQIKLALFGSAGNTVNAGIRGLINIARGGAVGILLIVPSLFYLAIKFYIAAFIGYVVFMAMLASFILGKILTKMGNSAAAEPILNNLNQAYSGSGYEAPAADNAAFQQTPNMYQQSPNNYQQAPEANAYAGSTAGANSGFSSGSGFTGFSDNGGNNVQ